MTTGPPDLPPPAFSEPRRARLHEQLSRLGRGPAALYRDACRFFDGVLTAETGYHLAGHLERELLSSVEDVLVPLGYAPPKPSDDDRLVVAIVESVGGSSDDTKRLRKILDRHFNLKEGGAQAKREAIMASLGTSDETIADLWKELNLQAVAHRSGLETPPPLETIREQWGRFERLLSTLLDLFDITYSTAYVKIDAILAKEIPGKDDLKLFRKTVPQNSATVSYFFSQVSGRRWFEILTESDIFAVAPISGGWPALAYLKRSAAEYPDGVSATLRKLSPTTNPFIQMELIGVAQQLPSAMGMELLHHVLSYLMGSPSPESFVARDLAEAASGHASDDPAGALLIITTLLELNRPSSEPKVGYSGSRELVAHFDIHTYGHLARGPLQVVTHADPRMAFDAIAELLDRALRAVYGDTRRTDFSKGWMPAIEPHPQNHFFEPLPYLVDALRTAAEKACAAHPAGAEDVIHRTVEQGWLVFRRLALHLARVSSPPTDATARDLVMQRENFDNYDLRHEYWLLVAPVFPHLDSKSQRTLVDWILADPVLDEAHFDDEAGKEEYIGRWKLRRLARIADFLPEDARTIYDGFLRENSPPDEKADFDGYVSTMWVGPTSPKTAQDLAAMTGDELSGYLHSWTPPPGHMVETREGLGRTLAPVIETRAGEISAVAGRFIALDATYVRFILSGLTEAVKNKRAISWEPVLALCRWAVAQDREIPGRTRKRLDDDPHWGWTRAQIARLLQHGFVGSEAQIPLELRSLVWEVLEPITHDPDPGVERQNDPMTTAINSTRGVAMESVIFYAAWVRGGWNAAAEGEADFHDIPEVRTVLARHLDVVAEPSLAVRAVYGERLFFLHLLAPAWLRDNQDRLFPENSPDHAAAVWQTYLVYGRFISPEFTDQLWREYERAVAALRTSDEPLYSEYPNRLAQQLVLMYLNGHIEISEGSLFQRFFDAAQADTREYLVALVPQMLDDVQKGDLDAARARAEAFWAWRLRVSPDGAELRGVGLWVRDDRFDADWRLTQLKIAIERAGVPSYEFYVIETLGMLATTNQEGVLECLNALVERAADHMELYQLTYTGEVERILRGALTSDNAAVRKLAESVTNTLISRGFNDFLRLLRSREIQRAPIQ